MLWSMLHPLLTLLIMTIVFKEFFGRETNHYTIYVFCGTILFGYFKEATTGGMLALVENSAIFSKVKLPKILFLLSKNVSSLINFGLTLILLLLFVIIDGIPLTLNLLCLIYPIICLLIFNIGVGLILSTLYVFFKDMQYIYDIFTMLLMYLSATFYTILSYSPLVQKLFHLNPIFCFIDYFRTIIIDAYIPSIELHLLCAFYSFIVLFIGSYLYKKFDRKFMYYL